MSLMDEYNSECILLVKGQIPDGTGGTSMGWVDSIHFNPSFEYEASPEIIIAEQQGVSRVYRVYIDKDLTLDYHDVFRRVEDGIVFRVTNPGTDRHTPNGSMINKRLVEVEKWELPHEFSME